MGDLLLGTAQLGQRYGIANRTGQPDAGTAHAIVAAAWEVGIRAFDTAPDYGDAEWLLGAALAAIGASADTRVITKLDARAEVVSAAELRMMVEQSRARLGVPRIDGLLVRRTLLSAWARVQQALQQLVADGIVGRVGVSVYTPEEALAALDCVGVSFIQVPTSVLDRRFLAGGVFDRARVVEKKVVVRSVFLQGLLTMAPDEAPPIPGAQAALRGVRQASEELGMPPLALALAYVRERCPDADVLVGAETPAQIAEITACWQQPIAPCAVTLERYVPAGAVDLVDPTRWHADVR